MDAERGALLARLARFAALAVLVVVAASAYLRLAQAGFSCPDWPACYGHAAQNAERLANSDFVFWVRVAHRVAAMVISVAVLLIVYLAWRLRAPEPRLLRWALTALALTAFLALLGRWTPGTRLPAVTIGNLLAGFTLLAVLWRLARREETLVPGRSSLVWLFVLLLVALQVSLGGLLSARFAGPACPSYPSCGAPVEFASAAFDPFQAVVPDASGGAVRDASLTGIVMAHRALATVLALGMAGLALRAIRRGKTARSRALALFCVFGFEYALGVGVALTAPPLLLVFAHNFGAALIVLLLAEGPVPGTIFNR